MLAIVYLQLPSLHKLALYKSDHCRETKLTELTKYLGRLLSFNLDRQLMVSFSRALKDILHPLKNQQNILDEYQQLDLKLLFQCYEFDS